MSDIDENLRHWSALFSTDPKQTKPFQRSGGFKGTAIKPIWNIMRLTEHFGPIGTGWGTDEPNYKLVESPATGEILVYCTLRCWYKDDPQNPACEPSYIWGVGGDKAIQQRAGGIAFADDDAFKKAFTDALVNAFMRVGVSADVYMGLFEDSKYLANVREQYDNTRAIQGQLTDNYRR